MNTEENNPMEPENPTRPDQGQNLDQRILQLVASETYKPAKPRVITRLLGLEADEVVTVRRLIKRMVRAGRLAFGPKHLVLPAFRPEEQPSEKKTSAKTTARRTNEIQGTFRKTSQPFGFVTPSDYFGNDRAQDIFIPPGKCLDASNRDTVLVRLTKSRRPGDERLTGRVVKVIERRTHRFVGTYRERGDEGYVYIDNEQFDAPVLVGDASAKNGRVGDKVVVEMVHFPQGQQAGEAVIVEILGPRGQPGVDTQIIIAEFGLPGDFSADAMEAAHFEATEFDESRIEGRTDFTDRTVVTIDPRTARDFDDAISLDRLDNGNWELGVHIADVSHFVKQGSPLDHEAYLRGTSVYLPDKVIPMLPEVISNNLASLQPHRVRYTMSVLIELTDDGQVIHADWYRSAIRSDHRFNYEEIDDYLADAQPWKSKLSPEVFDLVRNMHSLAMAMRQRRMNRGAIDLALPDVSIDLDDDGRVSGAHVESYTESHQLIEEFMLAANEAVAQKLYDAELFYLRRIHEPPAEKKLRDLTDFVKHLGIPCESLESRFEIRRVIALANEMPEKQAINFAVLRSMQKAVYSPKEVGHYALASKQYCHFTSPIRRYPDLVIHRMVADMIAGKKPMSDFDKLEQIGQHCSDMEQRAEQAERELIKLKLLNFLAERVGMELEVLVTGVEAFGLFVQGVELPAEGLLPLDHLPDDQYWYDDVMRTLSGRRAQNTFRLGDRLNAIVKHVDPDRRQLEFAIGEKGLRRKTRAEGDFPKQSPPSVPSSPSPRRRARSGKPEEHRSGKKGNGNQRKTRLNAGEGASPRKAKKRKR